MRKIAIVVAAGLAVASLVPAGAAARHNLAHRVSTLEAKVTALQRRTNALAKFTNDCIASDWVPIGWYGDETRSLGYVFDNDGAGPLDPFYTSALDIASNAQQTAFYTVAVNPGCLGQVAARGTSLHAEVDTLSRTLRTPRALR